MRILLLADCYLPSTTSGAKHIHDLAVELCRMGHVPILVVPDATISGPVRLCTEQNFSVLLVKTGKIKGVSFFTRGWNESRLSQVVWRHAASYLTSHPCELIVWYAPTIFFAGLVRRLKALWGCPAYLVHRDIFPQWAVDAGVLRRGLPYLYLKCKEWQHYAAADVIGVQSPANLEYFVKRGWDRRRRLEVLYTWAPLDVLPKSSVNYRKIFGFEGKVVFFYGGNIGVAQDMDNLVRLAKALSNEPLVSFLVVGEGSETSRLRQSIANLDLRNIQIRDAVPQNEFTSLVGAFDVGVITLAATLKTHNYPGKTLSYWAASLPILASLNPGNDLQDLLEDAGAGLVSINGDDSTFCEHALRLARNPNLRREMGVRGRRLLEDTFSVSRAVEQILGHFKPSSKSPLLVTAKGTDDLTARCHVTTQV